MTQSGVDARAQALATLAVLDTPTERAFDDIVYIAAQTCNAPIALVSLLDGERQWFKARVGLDVGETPIDQSVCKIDADHGALLEIPDLTRDPRTANNVLVTGERALRFYAGAPLVMRDGVVIGRLCVIDTVARPEGLSDDQRALLSALARQVSDHLELRRITMASRQMIALQSALMQIGDRIRHSQSIAEMTRSSAAVVGTVLKLDRAGFGTVDPGTETVEVEPDWTAPGVATIAGRHRFEDFGDIREELARGEPLVIADVTTDRRTAANPQAMTDVGIGALVNMPVRDARGTIAVFIAHSCVPRHWSDEELAFLRSVADRLEAGVSRWRIEEQQRTINGEISHRLKNMLAMVQAIASQTLRGIADREPIDTFERRLMALSGAHDVLMQNSWTEAELGAVAAAGLEPFGFGERVTTIGPSVPLGPRAALSLSLVVHELMTNACKYGALSNDTGRVTIDWGLEDHGGEDALVIRWCEAGGPPVATPARRGFGSKLIRLGLVGTGGVELRYDVSGFSAEFRAATAHLAQS